MKQPSQSQTRIRLAQEAARIMIEGGITDFASAKRKAAAHLGVGHTRNLPRNQEIEQARRDYQQLFHGQQDHRRRLEKAATQAMRFLQDFHPRLTGQLLDGCPAPHAAVELHLFADTPEAVPLFLDRHQIPYQQQVNRYRFGRDSIAEVPLYTFMAGDAAIELSLFPVEGQRRAPLSRVDGQPMRRAGLEEVEALFDEGPESAIGAGG